MIAANSKAKAIGIHQPQNVPEPRYRRGGGDVTRFFLLVVLRMAMRLEWKGAIQLLMPIAMRSAWAAACSKQAKTPWQPLPILPHPFAPHRP